VILDTNVWWRYLTAGRMAQVTRQRIEQARAAGQLQIAAVTLWELALLVQQSMLRVDGGVGKWLQTALLRSGTRVAPLEPGAAQEAARLAATLDPAGCQIIGTAAHLGVALASRDRGLLAFARSLGLEALEA